VVAALIALTAFADPCGMVPPITARGAPAATIQRQGLQQTYVFYRDGVQTIAIRPGFTGTVEEFGMLVPLPAVPSLRKIDDRTFEHLANAIDPPEVTVHVVEETRRGVLTKEFLQTIPTGRSYQTALGASVRKDEVRVVREEAVGMYEVAVLAAGSSTALQRWMDEHRYRYPDGMDDTVEDYVDLGWMFVAIKASVGTMAGVAPRPGMRQVQTGLPPGGSFDGYVQGMAFRFEVDEPVIPMRLSVFNGDDTHNRVFVVSERPVGIVGVSDDLVRRQLDGRTLHANLTEPLTVRYEGPPDRISQADRARVDALRDPDAWVVAARDIIVSDLMAEARGEMSLPFEEREKELLRINEALGLRGAQQLAEERTRALEPALDDLYEVTLSVIDGDLPARLLREDDLSLASFRLSPAANRAAVWNVQPTGPTHWAYYAAD
jgi:hypothetical protein